MNRAYGPQSIWPFMAVLATLIGVPAGAAVQPILATTGDNVVIARCLKNVDKDAKAKLRCVFPLDNARQSSLARAKAGLVLLGDQKSREAWFTEAAPDIFPAALQGSSAPPPSKADQKKYYDFLFADEALAGTVVVPIAVDGHNLVTESRQAAGDPNAQKAHLTLVSNAVDKPVSAALSLRADIERVLATKVDAKGRVDGVNLGLAQLGDTANAAKTSEQVTLGSKLTRVKAQESSAPDQKQTEKAKPGSKNDTRVVPIRAIAAAGALLLVLLGLAVADLIRWRLRQRRIRKFAREIQDADGLNDGAALLAAATRDLGSAERKSLMESPLGRLLDGGYRRTIETLRMVPGIAEESNAPNPQSELEDRVKRLVARLDEVEKGLRVLDTSSDRHHRYVWCTNQLHWIVLGKNTEGDAGDDAVWQELQSVASNIRRPVEWVTLPNLVQWFRTYRSRTREFVAFALGRQTDSYKQIEPYLDGDAADIPAGIRHTFEAQGEAARNVEQIKSALRDYALEGGIQRQALGAQAVAERLATAARAIAPTAFARSVGDNANTVIAELNKLRMLLTDVEAAKTALTDVNALLGAYAASLGESLQDSARERARAARDIALSLDQIAKEAGLAERDGSLHSCVEALGAELRNSAEQRAETSRILEDYNGAMKLLELEFERLGSEIGEEATMSLLGRIKVFLSNARARKTRIEELEHQLSEAGALIKALERETVKERERYGALRLEAEGIRLGLETVLENALQKFAGIGPDKLAELGMGAKTSGGLDTKRVTRLVDSLDAKFLVLQFACRLLSHEMDVLTEAKRDDVIEAVYIARISNGLTDLYSRCVQFGEQNSGQQFDAETFYRRVFVHCFQEGWLHLLFRADCVGAAYFAASPQLARLQNVVAVAAKIVELLLKDAEVAILRPTLFSIPADDDARKRFGVEEKFKALPEVRKTLAPYIERGEGVAVDIYEVGLDSPWRQFPPCVIALNLAEWR